VRAWRGAAELDLGSPQQRAVLAMLLLARGRQVPVGVLIDGLWGSEAPKTALTTVRVYISRLRHILARSGASPITSVADGYALATDPAALDLTQFEQHVTAGRAARRAGDAVQAAARLRDALAQWHGTPLAGLPGPWAQARQVQLTELYLAVAEDELALRIALGEPASAVAELRLLSAEHPFREHLTELLMLALYQSGRQADALAAYTAVREQLDDELGISPGLALRDLHQRILRADDRLLAFPERTRPAALGLARVA
jgi:DNA-binding SARP family transcriptional activator